MTYRSAIRSVLPFVAALLFSAAADAQIFRAYLASDGNDANPCTLPQPCRLLPAALAAVIDGGAIWMLDSANYNTATVNITKSVSILAVPGAVGSVVAVGGPAFSITTTPVNVSLRNLVITALPGAVDCDGVYMSVGGSLAIEHSLIADLFSHAVFMDGIGSVRITDTIIRNNVGYALRLMNGANGTISRTQMLRNASGVAAQGTNVRASVSDSIISGGTEGVFAQSGSNARILVTRSTIDGSTTALRSDGSSSVITVSYSMVTNSANAWSATGGGVVKSLGNNHFSDNVGFVGGALTAAALQ